MTLMVARHLSMSINNFVLTKVTAGAIAFAN